MKFIIRKLIGLIITLLIVSILAFLAFEVIPGDPARSILGIEATESRVRALQEEMGLNRPLTQRYTSWVKSFMTGDMGTSHIYQIPVGEMIWSKFPVTLTMSAIALFFILLFSISVSVVSVRYENQLVDRVFLFINQMTMSVPPFFVGIIFTIVFGLTLRIFTPGGYISYKEDVSGFLSYLILPAIAVALPKAAMVTKMLRNSLISEMRKEYVRTARSRGNSLWRVLLHHAFGNGFLPVITFLGMAIADMIASSIVVEQVFGIPGLGQTLISSISKRDYPVVEGIIVIIAVVILVINAIVDVLYKTLDKRIKI